MVDLLIFQKILLSLAIGALIGIERERRAKGELLAGVRTFMLVCMLGVLTSYLSDIFYNIVPIFIGFIFVGLLSVVGYNIKFSKTKSIGLTTEIALLIAFIIGVINYFDSFPYFLTVSIGVLLTLVLFSLEELHKFAHHLTHNELRDAIIFAILAFIISPIIPNRTIDPFNAINPYTIWLSMIIVLFTSFFAYVMMKVLGAKRGLTITGLFGGLVSSTAVTISMAEKVRENKGILNSAVFATIVASSTMFFRIIIISALFNIELAKSLILPLSIIGLLGYAFCCCFWRNVRKEKNVKIDIGSPLALKPALLFAVSLAAILFITKVLQGSFIQEAIYPLAILGGLVEVDAMVISLSMSALTGLSPMVAVGAIILAGLSNTFFKWFLAKWFGSKTMALETGKTFLGIILAGLVVLFLVNIIV